MSRQWLNYLHCEERLVLRQAAEAVAYTTGPMLCYPDTTKLFVVEVDALMYGVGPIL